MMSFLRKDDFEPGKKKGSGAGGSGVGGGSGAGGGSGVGGGSGAGDDGDKKGPSMNRIAIWVVVGAVGLYMLGSGLIGILTK